MAAVSTPLPVQKRSPWLASEDWWAVLLGLFIVLLTAAATVAGTPLSWLKRAVPAPWPKTALLTQLTDNWGAYLLTFALMAVLTSFAIYILTGRIRQYLLGFCALFVGAAIIMTIGSQEVLKRYGLESAFWSLVIGLIIGNLITLPPWLKAATSRTEFFIRTGIILLGAKISFSTILAGGAWGFLEAAVILFGGFATAFVVARKFGLDRRFAAVIGAAGSVCGVSAAIAMGGAVKADEKQVGYSSSLVVFYALILMFVMPGLSALLGLNEHVAGAWFGGSQLADAAGLATAAMISDNAVQTFSLVKLNRDILNGLLCFVFATLAVTRWEANPTAAKPDPRIIWDRFPKFVLAYLTASIAMTVVETVYGPAVRTEIVNSLNTLRNWFFVIAFLCIGLNTKVKDVRAMGARPIIVFTAVVAVNFIAGFAMANLLFGGIIAAPLK